MVRGPEAVLFSVPSQWLIAPDIVAIFPGRAESESDPESIICALQCCRAPKSRWTRREGLEGRARSVTIACQYSVLAELF